MSLPLPLTSRDLQSSSATTQRNLAALFSALLLAMKPAVALPAADLLVFLRSSLERTLSAQNEVQLAATVHLLGSTVNKRAPGKLYFRVFRYWSRVLTLLTLLQRRPGGLSRL